MRRAVAPAVLSLSAVLLTPGAAGASAHVSVEGVVKLDWGTKAQAPAACAGLTCGAGDLRPFGSTSWTTTDSNFVDTDTVVLTTPSGTLTAMGVGSGVVTPGASATAPGAAHSYGNPFCFTYDLTVTGGTGGLSGAAGSLPGTLCVAGASVLWKGGGTLTVG